MKNLPIGSANPTTMIKNIRIDLTICVVIPDPEIAL